MRVQIVAQNAEEALQSLRPEESDLDELDYQSPDENATSFSNAGPIAGSAVRDRQDNQAPSASGRQRLSYNQRSTEDDAKMNRADRRRMEKEQQRKR